jgi:hypothetical protein
MNETKPSDKRPPVGDVEDVTPFPGNFRLNKLSRIEPENWRYPRHPLHEENRHNRKEHAATASSRAGVSKTTHPPSFDAALRSCRAVKRAVAAPPVTVNRTDYPVCGSAVFDGMRSLSTACVARTARRASRCNRGATETRKTEAAVAGQGRRPAVPGLNELIGADIEVRTLNGSSIRGTLLSASPDWLAVEKALGGRLTLVRVEAVASITDELAPGLRPAGRRHAEDAEDREAE